jgi:hypothetical protein
MSLRDDFEKEEEHESYGMVGFSRVHGCGGGTRRLLFGSHLANHHETIVMRVKTATRKHGLSHDWHHGDQELIEIEMSPAQFAQLLTSMNFGDGVPCTIRYLVGKGMMEPVPDSYVPEQVKILENVKVELEEMVGSLDGRRARLQEILSKKSINKGDREEIVKLSSDIWNWFESHAPFAFESFEESAEKVVTAAKSQVEEFALATLVKLGMEKLAERFQLSEHFGTKTSELPPPRKGVGVRGMVPSVSASRVKKESTTD